MATKAVIIMTDIKSSTVGTYQTPLVQAKPIEASSQETNVQKEIKESTQALVINEISESSKEAQLKAYISGGNNKDLLVDKEKKDLNQEVYLEISKDIQRSKNIETYQSNQAEEIILSA